MKKMIVLILLAMSIAGCGKSLVQSEFWQHDAMYASWDHAKFSWFGHRSPTAEDSQKAREQGWWGMDVPYVPGR